MNNHIHVLVKFKLDGDYAAWSQMSKKIVFFSFSEIIESLLIL